MKNNKLIVIGLALLLVGIVIGVFLAGSEVGPVTSTPKAEADGGIVKSAKGTAPGACITPEQSLLQKMKFV